MKIFFEPLPVIFSMNGGVKYYPRNTIQAFRAGFDEGADAASVSIQLSSDSRVMVIPDPLLDGICEKSGTVLSYTAAELKAADAGYRFTPDGTEYPHRGKGFCFLTLDELLEAFPDKKFNVIIVNKDKNLVRAYADVLNRYAAADRVLTASLHGSNISLFRKLMPQAATSFSMSGIVGIYALFKSGLIYFAGGFRADSLQTAESVGASYFANASLVKQMHKRGIWVQVWDVREPAQFRRLQAAGVDSFMTEDVPALIKMMRG